MKTVNIIIRGGMVQGVDMPEGIQVIVHDYDVSDWVSEEEIEQHKKDKDGDLYWESVWP